MIYKILADVIVIIHFLWILFMLLGFLLILYSILSRNKKLLFLRLFRVVHLCGIFYVASLAILDKYCPLTLLETHLREKAGYRIYQGSFIIHYIEKLVYPEVEPQVIIIPTIGIAIFTIISFIIYPPHKRFT